MIKPDPARYTLTRLPAANVVFTPGPAGYTCPPMPAATLPPDPLVRALSLRPAIPAPRQVPASADATTADLEAETVLLVDGVPLTADDFLGSDDDAQRDSTIPASPADAAQRDSTAPASLDETAGPVEPTERTRLPAESDTPPTAPGETGPPAQQSGDGPSATTESSAPTAEPVEPDPVPLDAPLSPAPAGADLPSASAQALGDEIATELSAQAQPAPQRPDHGEWRGIVLVTGTDTDVGKTIVTAAVAAAAQASGLRVAVIKPGQTGIATGTPTDIEVITRLAAPDTTRVLAEYPEPMAPLAAATLAQLPPLELYTVVDVIRAEADKHDLVLVEGAGGLLVPMGVRPSGEAWTFADLAIALGVKTIVVARAGLGTLNHTALTLEALNRRGVPAGVVIGAWPPEPELVHWANLSELAPHLMGALPDGAGSMDPGVFRRSAPGWLTPPLYGVIDNWRVWAEETDGH